MFKIWFGIVKVKIITTNIGEASVKNKIVKFNGHL